MMKKLIILFLACCMCAAGRAQLIPVLEREVVATAGDTARAADLRFFYTIGQPFTETLFSFNGSVVFTQGFQQALDGEITSLEDELQIRLSYNIFPNPVADVLTVKLETDTPVEIDMSMFDIRGQEIGNAAQRIFVTRERETEIDLRSEADGVYTLMLKEAKSGKILRMFKVQKVH